MVIRLAVRLAITLEEVLGAQLVAAVEADKVLRVPRPAERRHHLSKKMAVRKTRRCINRVKIVNQIFLDLANNWLLARRAASFRGGRDPVLVHVSLFLDLKK